ncbi:MAG TPA: sigma factor, partial [Chryseosolibacter sp.]
MTSDLNLRNLNPPAELNYGQPLARPDIDQLFNRVRKDDYTAFGRIFKANYARLCAYSNRFVLNRQLAEEIVDDVFCNLWKNRKRIRISSSFQAYLITSVRNRS